MNTLSEMEIDAAGILEFHDFNPAKEDEMVADMNMCHKRKYGRQQRKDFFADILKSKTKEPQIRAYLQNLRDNAAAVDLESVMTEAEIAKFDKDSDIFHPLKYWFYTLYRSYDQDEIEIRYLDVQENFAQYEIDANPDCLHMIEFAGYWLEFYEFDWTHKKEEIIKTVFRDFNGRMEGVTYRMCKKILQDIVEDRRGANQNIFEKHAEESRELIASALNVDELRKYFQRGEFDSFPIEEGREAFVKYVYEFLIEEFTAETVKSYASEFYDHQISVTPRMKRRRIN